MIGDFTAEVKAVQFKGESNKFEIAELLKGRGEFYVSYDFEDEKNPIAAVAIPYQHIVYVKKGEWLVVGIGFPQKFTNEDFKKTFKKVESNG